MPADIARAGTVLDLTPKPRSGPPNGLLGRADECGMLGELLEDVRRGESRSLILRGDAGIGKTALLEHLVESASDATVAPAVGVESEAALPFAGLHQLCAPMLGRLARLPAPQRDALDTVFGRSPGGVADRFLVGLAVLSLFSEVARGGPLLCVVDDAQWLDQASALTLAFVARRLVAEPVAIVFAARAPGRELEHVSELALRGLRDDEARTLLGTAAHVRLDDRVRDRIVAETGGNPGALLEFARWLTGTELGILTAPEPRGRVEDGLVRRLGAFEPDVARLSLVAAAEPLGDPALLWRAARRLGIDPTAADAAAAAGLLVIGDRVTFRDPAARSAVYHSASAEDRRAVHAALGAVTDRELDPDRRTWHLAAAAAGPDEGAALELERSAGQAQARGGFAAGAAFLRRAAALTVDPVRYGERALAAAEASFQAGAFDAALGLAATAGAEALDEVQRARVSRLRGHVASASGLASDGPALLLKAARQLEPLDMDRARDTYLAAWGAAASAGAGVLPEICRAARALPPVPSTPRPRDLLLDGLASLTTDGRATATPTLQRAVAALADMPAEDLLRLGWPAGAASAQVWDFDSMLAIAVRQVRLCRDAGALAQLPVHLSQLGLVRAWTGDFAAAILVAGEIDTLVAATGTPIAPSAALLLRALQGSEEEASAATARAMNHAAGRGRRTAGVHVDWATAILYNGLARYREAAAAARRAADTGDPLSSMWALPELVESAARGGDRELAREALERLAQVTQPSATDFGLGIEARSRALLATGDAADRLYREAIERLGRTRLRTERARAQLLYGEWLRREGRRIDTRAQLGRAHEEFTSMGMQAFAERTRKELLAAGGQARRRTRDQRDELTAQEMQIARLARDGPSNPEIGARLFLSPRTVEWHLRKVFTKLAIRSRRDLPKALETYDAERAAGQQRATGSGRPARNPLAD